MSRVRVNAKSDLVDLHRRIKRMSEGSLFAQRQIIVRARGRVRCISIPGFVQAFGLLALCLVGFWVTYSSYAFIAHDRIVSSKNTEIEKRDKVNRRLRSELTSARRNFSDAMKSLEKNHKGLVSLVGRNKKLKENLGALRLELHRVSEARTRAKDAEVISIRRADTLERSLSKTEVQNRHLALNLQRKKTELKSAIVEKSRVTRQNAKMETHVQELKQKVATLREAQSNLLDRVSGVTGHEVKRLVSLIKTTGIKLRHLDGFKKFPKLARGGPFEPAGVGNRFSDDEAFDVAMIGANQRIERLTKLRDLFRALPLAAPLDYFYITSKYGKRKDPINGLPAMHHGVDLGSKNTATVLAPAPGKVTYAGWKGRFGRLVRIYHGAGVVTRYGHLRRIYVKVGQKVNYRTPIAQMGSSGRSTGTHLHYEIVVKGRSYDPIKFVKAGKNVFK